MTDDLGIPVLVTKTTDPVGNWRLSGTDALGRLVRVREPNPNIPGQYLTTDYTYDELDNLLTVDQSGRARTFTYDGLGRLLSAENPESGKTTYDYDGNGNLSYRKDADSLETWFAYDQMNRPTVKTYSLRTPQTPNVTWDYTGPRLNSVSTSDGIVQSYTYSPGGRIQTSTQAVGAIPPYTFSYQYNMDGSLSAMQYPSARLVTYDLKDTGANTDLAGRVKRITTTTSTAPSTRIDRIDYNENGLISALTLGNGLVEHWSYNARLQPIDIRLDNGQSAVVGEWQFGYCAGAVPGADCGSNNGNVRTQLILPVNIYQNYNYDVLNRISGIEESASPGVPSGCPAGTTLCREFKYDDWASLYVASTRVMPTTAFTPVGASNFNAKNQLQINNAAYNLVGTQSAIGDYHATYDHENRLVNATLTGVSSTTYQYDGLGRRVSKTSGSSTTIYVYDASGNLAAEYGSPAAASGERYLTADHLGSIRLTTDGSGIADRRLDYLPFGEIIPAGVGGRTTGMGYEADESISPHRLRFTGKERDAETGLDYFGARYFSGAQARFTSPDAPFADQHPDDPQSWNLYTYGRNNPLRFVDPTGQAVELVGSEEEREEQLKALRQAVGKKAGSYLYPNAEKDKDGNATGRYFVGVLEGGPSGKGPAFGSLNAVATDLAGVIADKQVAQVHIMDANESFVYNGLTGAQTSLNSDVTGRTSPFNAPSPIKVWVLNPDTSYAGLPGYAMDNGQSAGRTITDNLLHELGHAAWQMDEKGGRSVTPPDPYGDRRALKFENDVRRLRGGATRRIH